MSRLPLLSLVILLLGSCGNRALSVAAADGGPVEGCRRRPVVQPPTVFSCNADHPASSSLEVSDGWIYYVERDAPSSGPHLFARQAATNQVKQLTSGAVRANLLATEAGEVFYSTYRYGTDAAVTELFYQSRTGLVALGSRTDHRLDGVWSQFTQRAARLISGGEVVWDSSLSLRRYQGGTTRALAGASGHTHAEIDHQAGRVVWVEGQQVYLHQGETTTRISSDGTINSSPQISGTALLWICDESICLQEGGSTRTLDRGKCGNLIARGGQAAWVCDGQVMLWDGSTARAIAGARGDKLVRDGLRLDAGRLLWLEADPGQFDIDARGKIYFSDGNSTLLLQEVGLPCLVCSAYWPPLWLALSGEVASWSYHPTGASPLVDGQRCAFSIIGEQLDCDS